MSIDGHNSVSDIRIGMTVWTVAEFDGNRMNESEPGFLMDCDGRTYKVCPEGAAPTTRLTSGDVNTLLEFIEQLA